MTTVITGVAMLPLTPYVTEIEEESKRPRKKRKIDPIGFQPGHHCIVSGATGRGKTRYVVDAILGTGIHKGRKGPWDGIVVMCDEISMEQPEYERLYNKFKGKSGVQFVEGLPKNPEEEANLMEDLKNRHKDEDKTLLIIDDLMTDSNRGHAESFINKMFTSARHYGVDCWQINQQHTSNRTRRLQAGYLVCFATPSDKLSIQHLARCMHPEDKGHRIMQAYDQAVQNHDGHGCLVVCMNQKPEYMFRNTDMKVCFDMTTPINVVTETKSGTSSQDK